MAAELFCPSAALVAGACKAKGGLLVARLEDGALVAVDAACPHQGYPLAQGSLQGCVITCAWHNFKFDLRTGAAVIGEEGLKQHRVYEQGGEIWVERDEAVDVGKAWRSLGEAMGQGQLGRAARELGRLRLAGLSFDALLVWIAATDANHAEYSPSHTGALAWALRRWQAEVPAGQDPFVHELQLLTEAAAQCAEATRGRPARPRPAPVQPGADATEAARAFAAAVEAERADEAEGRMRGFVAAGWDRAALRAALSPVVSAHFLDFGHALIYAERMLDLAALDGGSAADAILGGYAFGLANGTRESALPSWAGFRAKWAAWSHAGGPARAAAALAQGSAGPEARAAAAARVVEAAAASGPASALFDVLKGIVEEGEAEGAIDGLVLAASGLLLQADLATLADPEIDEGWLDLTHRLTAAHALREPLALWPAADALRLLLLVGHFVALGRGLSGPPVQPEPAPDPQALIARALSDRAARPIFFAHDVKVLQVAIFEAELLGDPAPLQAAHRYLWSPVQERSARKLAVEAARLLREGKPPRGLTG